MDDSRHEALSFALRYHEGVGRDSGNNSNDIVDTAKKFYDFIDGSVREEPDRNPSLEK